MGICSGRGAAFESAISASLAGVQHARVAMSPSVAVVLVLLSVSFAQNSVPSVEFAKSADSENEFEKSVNADAYGGAHENEVARGGGGEEKFLRNFKSLHNATDLQALASDVQQQGAVAEESQGGSADTAASRVDTGPRVLRGAHPDYPDLSGVPALDHPLFTPYKHNRIDTADFSDCALQGEWKPIGVPSNHYAHLAEDHQKEHFHSGAEGQEAFPSIAAPNTHSPLDAEGLAFWNQFMKETHSNPSFLHHDKYPKKQKHHHHQREPHPHHHYPRNQHRVKQPPPPPRPQPIPQTVQELDVFEKLRNPGDVNVFQIKQKPTFDDEMSNLQNGVPNQPSFSDLEFALLQGNSNDGVSHGLQHYESLPGGSHGPQEGNSFADAQFGSNSGPYHGPSQGSQQGFPQGFHQNHQNEDYLSPPPAPHRFHLHKPPQQDRPKLPPPRPKYIHKPHKTQHRVKGPAPLRVPPPVVEHPEDPIRGGSFPHQIPSESSTFTCGHNHAEGTNYHTASYQVEGESDPSLLEEDVHGSNHLVAPIIVGQPSFDHGPDEALFDRTVSHRFPKQHGGASVDLEEEGTETGGSNGEEVTKELEQLSPFAEQLVQHTNGPETATQASSLDTTAPQTFHTEAQNAATENIKQVRPAKSFYHGSGKQPNSLGSSFDIGFDHSGFSEVDVNSFQPHSHPENLNGERISFSRPGPGQELHQQGKHQVLVHQEHAVSHSEPNGFFATPFGPQFTESFNRGSQNAERNPNSELQFPQQPMSFSEFSFPPFKTHPKGKYHKASIAVFDHPPPHNKTKTHLQPKRKRPHKHYEVNEKDGEMIPVTALFPPKKMPKQFDMRTPNIAVPKAKRPKAPKYASTVQYDGSNLGIYQSHPRSKVTKIRLKSKNTRGNGSPRFLEPDFRRSLTIQSRIH